MKDKDDKKDKKILSPPDAGLEDIATESVSVSQPKADPATIATESVSVSQSEADENILRTTRAVLLDPSEVKEQPGEKAVLLPDTVAIHLPGRRKPLIFQGMKEILMGRSHIGDKQLPDVDFITDRGGLLGVSRRHAAIRQVGKGYIVEDLNSTNGTWVNGSPLVPGQHFPLENGDQVQLGQLILFIYFSNGDEEVIDTIFMMNERRSTVTPQDGISLSFLTDTIIPYLKTIIEIQKILDIAGDTKEQPSGVGIQTIALHKDRRQIKVGIHGITKAVIIVRDIIIPWRMKIRQRSADKENLGLSAQGLPDEVDKEQDKIRLTLAEEIVSAADNALTEEKQNKLVEQLLPHINYIINSDLRLTV